MKLEKVADFAGIPTTITIEELAPRYGFFSYAPAPGTLKYAKVVQLQKTPEDTSSELMVARQWDTFLTYNGLYRVDLEKGDSGYVPMIYLQGYTLESLNRANAEKIPSLLKADNAEAELMAQWFEAVLDDLDNQFSFVE